MPESNVVPVTRSHTLAASFPRGDHDLPWSMTEHSLDERLVVTRPTSDHMRRRPCPWMCLPRF